MGLNRSIPKVSLTSVAVAAAFAPAQHGGSAVDSACEVRSSIIKPGDRYTWNTACKTHRPNVARTSLKTPHSQSVAAIYIDLFGALKVHLQ